MARSRRRHRSRTPFRAWGLLLTLLAGLLAWQGDWPGTALISGLLACYLLMVRLTRCRVETLRHQPCRWRVRGILGTCDYHTGYKRSLPVLARGNNFTGLPTFMWPRDDFTPTPTTAARPEPQPSPAAAGTAATSQRAKRPRYDWAMMGLAAAGVAIALASLAWDVLTR
jgi:hypothetical protein